jgi:hypothetical protein
MSVQKKSLVNTSKSTEKSRIPSSAPELKGKAPKGEKQTNLRRK